ncbi:MAG: dihydroorotase [Sporomusa sp.]|nr:dihydroorotase [Sporomusa sp.]
MGGEKNVKSTESVLLKNGRVIDPAQGIDGTADVLISEGRIAAIAPNLCFEEARVLDCSGKWVVPGLIDVHCHLREPGSEHKETIETGTKAAAHGGFTTIVAMANLNPTPDKLSVYNKIQKLIAEKAVVRVIQAASVTKDLRGRDLCDMATLAAAGVRLFSDDGRYIDRASVLYQALQLAKKLDVVIFLHEEDATLKSYWPTAYEPVNEVAAIARDLEILRVTGGKVHFQHLSTANSVELIRRAKKEGLNVTAEVCPHHLTLSLNDVATQGTNAKMAPPLRAHEDIAELIHGLNDGTVDMIATDHAPHAIDDKNVTFDLAASGIVGFETALPILLTKLVHE